MKLIHIKISLYGKKRALPWNAVLFPDSIRLCSRTSHSDGTDSLHLIMPDSRQGLAQARTLARCSRKKRHNAGSISRSALRLSVWLFLLFQLSCHFFHVVGHNILSAYTEPDHTSGLTCAQPEPGSYNFLHRSMFRFYISGRTTETP